MEKFYFAPLEGTSGYVYRKAYEHYFGGIDKYFIPFIKPNQKGKLSSREKNDILPMQSGDVCDSSDFDQFGGGFYEDGRKAGGIRV